MTIFTQTKYLLSTLFLLFMRLYLLSTLFLLFMRLSVDLNCGTLLASDRPRGTPGSLTLTERILRQQQKGTTIVVGMAATALGTTSQSCLPSELKPPWLLLWRRGRPQPEPEGDNR
jgi:hypothetical protein